MSNTQHIFGAPQPARSGTRNRMEIRGDVQTTMRRHDAPMTVADIASRLSHTRSAVRAAIKHLYTGGRLERRKNGRTFVYWLR